MNQTEHNIVIAGAGPVGLFTALRLSHLGVQCTLLEAGEELSTDLRASTFHPPTLELLDEYGVTAELIDQGRVCPTWQVRLHPSHDHVEFDLSILSDETRHPYRVQCEQDKLCAILLDKLRARSNVELMMGVRVTGHRQSDDHVLIDTNSAAGDARIKAKFLVGADGAKSAVRKGLEIPFEGSTYPETTILTTTTFAFEEHLPGLSGINYCWKPEGTFSLLRLPELWRCSLYPDTGESVEDAVQPDAIERKLQAIVPRAERYEIDNVRPYRIHMRIVERYDHGRIVLAGDAAHLNSPSGGMGMNGGLQDAYLLADALHEIDNGGELSLLERYTRQRRPVANEQILKQADANRKRMQERDPSKRLDILAGLRAIADDAERCRVHLMNTSMISGWRRSMAAT